MDWLTFEYPLAVLLLLPLLYCLYRCKEEVKSAFFVHLHLMAPKRGFFKLEWLLKVLALVAMVAALSSPVLIDREDPLNRHGRDIVLCIDGSGSMNASGFEEGSLRSRFEITQEIAQEFVRKRVEDNVGVVLYGDFAFIASPVTYEKEIVAEMIGYLTHGMAGQNTAIGEGIAMSLRALQRSKAQSKVIVLLTDGEHNSGAISPKDATAIAAEHGVRIYTIGMGEKGGFDAALLETVAQQSGGAFFSAYDKEELAEVYARIDELERSDIKSRAYLNKSYYFAVPLGVAALVVLYLLYRRTV